jgi:hypothetical protein
MTLTIISPMLRLAGGQIDVRRLDGVIGTDLLRAAINGIGKGLVGRPAIAEVVLDAEIAVGAALDCGWPRG